MWQGRYLDTDAGEIISTIGFNCPPGQWVSAARAWAGPQLDSGHLDVGVNTDQWHEVRLGAAIDIVIQNCYTVRDRAWNEGPHKGS